MKEFLIRLIAMIVAAGPFLVPAGGALGLAGIGGTCDRGCDRDRRRDLSGTDMDQRGTVSFYRSRLFWLGLPGLVFLLWAWWVSMGHISQARFGYVPVWVIGQSAGEVFVFWNASGFPDWRDFHALHEKMSMEDASEWRRSLEVLESRVVGFRYVLFPHYAVVLAYAPAWLLTLAWWQRRKSRLLKLHTAP